MEVHPGSSSGGLEQLGDICDSDCKELTSCEGESSTSTSVS